MSDTTERPQSVEDEHIEYLVELRDSGTINMMGAVPYLERKFDIGKKEAEEIFFWWIENAE